MLPFDNQLAFRKSDSKGLRSRSSNSIKKNFSFDFETVYKTQTKSKDESRIEVKDKAI